ncbi:unnamed protein product [Closterium sp. NIES-65]|nr:unnamed protein product [Closterium sp. NIES-65]
MSIIPNDLGLVPVESKGEGADPEGEGADPEVTWEDQQNINKFGRLNNRLHELDDEIKAKKDYLENLEDASNELILCDDDTRTSKTPSNELILCDDDTVRYMAGEVFLHTDKDDVEGQLEALREKTSGEVEALEGEKSSLVAQMGALKVVLYGKFKDAINLEED